MNTQNNIAPMMFDMPKNKSASIKVIGVGGGGGNAVNHMFRQGISGVDFVICNTDAQALHNSPIPVKIQLGATITEGLGAGSNPEIGGKAAMESLEEIKTLLDTHTKMVFITAGMGGGTGTGAAPVIAGIAKDMGILTVGIVTMPFFFEGKIRLAQAEKGIQSLRENVDALIVISNDKIRELYGNLGFRLGFSKADEVLLTAAKGIAEVITQHYTQNIDLRDARTVLADSGTAIMGSAAASGENKAKEAIVKALDSPLLNDNKITGARNVLLLIISGKEEITIDEIGIINDYIQNEAGHNANIIMGIGEDEDMGDGISVTVIATGFPYEEDRLMQRTEERIFHTLTEEQPLEKNLSTSVQSIKEQNQQEPIPVEKSDEMVRYVLDEEEDTDEESIKNEKKSKVDEDEKQEDQDLNFSFRDIKKIDLDSSFIVKNTKENIAFPSSIQDENTREKDTSSLETTSQRVVTEKKVDLSAKEKSYKNPTDGPISESLNKRIEERRNKLKMFNYKFQQSAQEIDEASRTPAYKRQGFNLEQQPPTKDDKIKYTLSKDVNNDLKIREQNAFLHDNVD